ncbi:LysR family transcriptional regulator [Bradyrhizobium sp. U87765 SZCCT0131]|uniref:LysR family transcriptional regulator n=1 Tax=unclassified Bradyrhizobium TaxID=2631580 RepID=UPI001BAE0496|nr:MULTISPECIES: LysR family transcriptional regulator [unclassified Bradyrhizobium]MBR1222627.1 LysR family transcriptional regulator [Bradyrhizobium sp. U87765 SZCCT0131]MBR1265292.1 LysR family transcriptional regulator [Bradyrhizobium sp. U87765 SZCCT0134]MBR1302929.1 LysR family transcriptional regulator [Bradyrhizobium sp. U87765 SZCCT0110]MBR1323627.1 LysR family transcriptional regulator [Bradyrhizobium sp. U87765 SZCCT0109]MBR1346858.1 LysR family transcriptional regulator [Bradyrhizo
MDIRELRYFSAVFEARSLTAAARRCFVSQPSISAAIASLEAELGASLFIRHKKGVSPTAAAEKLDAIARRILDEADAARQLFRAPVERPTLTLGLMRTLDIPRTIALLKPVTADGRLQLRLVGATDKADARIVARSMVKPREQFIALWTDRYVAALPPAHPLTLKERLRAGDLADVPLVDRCHCEQSAFFGRRRRAPAVAIAESEDWAMALVAAGIGIAIVPEGVARARPDIAVRDIADVDVSRQVGLAYGATRAPSTALQTLISLVSPARKPPRRSQAA